MNILFLTARFPFPPLKGDQSRGYHMLRLLSQKHSITLVSFVEKDFSPVFKKEIEPYCKEIVTVPIGTARKFINILNGLSKRDSIQTVLYQSPEMTRVINQVLYRGQFDVAYVQLVRMASYLINSKMPRLLDMIDSLALNMERRYRYEKTPLKLIAYLEWQRLKAYERYVCQKYDQLTVVSPLDRELIGSPANLHVNSIGVDLEKFTFVEQARHDKSTIIFSGNMNYFPNVEAINWFVKEVFPIISSELPNIRLKIVGTNPHKRVRRLADLDPNIDVTGHVPDLHACLSSATVAIAPMRAGSGTQFKIIEAMACGTPVVATSTALAGIPANAGMHLLVADKAELFAAYVIQLLNDADLCMALAHNARMLVERNYSWEKASSGLEQILTMMLEKRNK